MNSNVEILDDIDKVTLAARNDFNQKNLKNIFCQMELLDHVGQKMPVQ